jgi:hypothetical protein
MLTKIFNLRGRTLLGAALGAASVMMALFAGCLNPANEADETAAAKSNAPLVPYSIEETTPATPKQAQKAEGFQVPVAQVYYFANEGDRKLYGLWNNNFASNVVAAKNYIEIVNYDENPALSLDTLTGRVRDLDSILVYIKMRETNLESEISKIQNKSGQAFYDALNKFVEDYTSGDGRTPRVI